jgi:hypothetical protein
MVDVNDNENTVITQPMLLHHVRGDQQYNCTGLDRRWLVLSIAANE